MAAFSAEKVHELGQLISLVDGDRNDADLMADLERRLHRAGGNLRRAANSYFQAQQQRELQEQNGFEIGQIWEVDLAFAGIDWQPKNCPAFREARVLAVRPHDIISIEWLQSGRPDDEEDWPSFPRTALGNEYDAVGKIALRRPQPPPTSPHYKVGEIVEVKYANCWWGKSKVIRIEPDGGGGVTVAGMHPMHPYFDKRVVVRPGELRVKSKATGNICGTLGCGRRLGHTLSCTQDLLLDDAPTENTQERRTRRATSMVTMTEAAAALASLYSAPRIGHPTKRQRTAAVAAEAAAAAMAAEAAARVAAARVAAAEAASAARLAPTSGRVQLTAASPQARAAALQSPLPCRGIADSPRPLLPSPSLHSSDRAPVPAPPASYGAPQEAPYALEAQLFCAEEVTEANRALQDAAMIERMAARDFKAVAHGLRNGVSDSAIDRLREGVRANPAQMLGLFDGAAEDAVRIVQELCHPRCTQALATGGAFDGIIRAVKRCDATASRLQQDACWVLAQLARLDVLPMDAMEAISTLSRVHPMQAPDAATEAVTSHSCAMKALIDKLRPDQMHELALCVNAGRVAGRPSA